MTEKNTTQSLFYHAFRKHLDGDYEEAERQYREILSLAPDDAEAMHFLGFLLQQTNRFAEAYEAISGAIALDDRHAEWHFNLGIVHLRLGDPDRAILSFSRATALDPRQYFYWTNLGSAFESIQDWGQAEKCYKEAARLNPHCPDAFYLLAAMLLKLERYDEARHFNYSGIVVEPPGNKSIIIMSQAYHELGRSEEAIRLIENWLKDEPDHPVPKHLLAAYKASETPETCSMEYIEETFDKFADSFDRILYRLHYSGPDLVKEYLSSIENLASGLKVLDLGCGTGLVGSVVSPYASTMDGVDLSQPMLDQALKKQIYQRMFKADIHDFLTQSYDKYDLIVCMDTFTYIGKLDDVITLMFKKLTPHGRLLFSTEMLGNPDESSYHLNISGRYSHSPHYIDSLLVKTGFKLEKMLTVDIRKESGLPIKGQFIAAIRCETP